MGKTKLFWRTDMQIRAPEVRLIGEDGKQEGIVQITDALTRAKGAGLTLVEISGSATPPVAKIVDFGKFRYQEEKKLRKQAKGAKGGELKEVRFSPFIAQGDYETRLKRVKEFLAEKNKVKVVVVFLGRHMGSKPFGYKLIGRILGDLGEGVTTDMEPKFLGRHLITIISPLVARGKPKENAKTKNQETVNE